MSHTVRAPLPGTFYHAASPESPPFVEMGQKVAPGDVIGLIEVMKHFMEIKADAGGVVSGIHADNEAPIMAGAALITLE